MSLAPRAVLVRRRSELDELVERHGTRGQAAFFLSTRGRTLDQVEARHRLLQSACSVVAAAVPAGWRRGLVERADLSAFAFEPEDVVVVVGQDGLVANVAKYLDGQPVVGVNPFRTGGPGVLVRHPPAAAGPLLQLAASRHLAGHVERRTMVAARTDDGAELVALNEVFLGPASHQTAFYDVAVPDGRTEHQASSGLIVATGTGATGWAASVAVDRRFDLPAPTDPVLAWFVREAWPSPSTGTSLTDGLLADPAARLRVTVRSDRLVVFGDGLEADRLDALWGQVVTIGPTGRTLQLVG